MIMSANLRTKRFPETLDSVIAGRSGLVLTISGDRVDVNQYIKCDTVKMWPTIYCVAALGTLNPTMNRIVGCDSNTHIGAYPI